MFVCVQWFITFPAGCSRFGIHLERRSRVGSLRTSGPVGGMMVSSLITGLGLSCVHGNVIGR